MAQVEAHSEWNGILNAVGLDTSSVGSLGVLFADSCAQNFQISFQEFTAVLSAHQIDPKFHVTYFRALDLFQTGFIDYREFILSLLCIHPNTLDNGNMHPQQVSILHKTYFQFLPCISENLVPLLLHAHHRDIECSKEDCVANAVASVGSTLSSLRLPETELTIEQFETFCSRLTFAISPVLMHIRYAAEQHHDGTPHITVNSAPMRCNFLPKENVWRFTIPKSFVSMNSLRIELGGALKMLVQEFGNAPLPVEIRLSATVIQNHNLDISRNYFLVWTLAPPFPIKQDILISVDASKLHAVTISGSPRVPSASAADLPIPEASKYSISMDVVKVSRGSGAVISKDTLQSLSLMRAYSDRSGQELRLTRTVSISTVTRRDKLKEILADFDRFAKGGYTYPSGPPPLKFYARDFIAIAEEVGDIVRSEPRLVRVAAPAYVFGDFHGNFEDLKTFESTFFRQGVELSPANLLFLGDYVDRRDFGVEVIMFLFINKLLAPSKVTLLRGNHEARDMNRDHGFRKECLSKFGGPDGERVWVAINKTFDLLPLCAVVGETVFCVHGGIPGPQFPGAELFERIEQIPCPLTDPENEDPLARDLLWSDPMEVDSAADFTDNPQRGISHQFSTNALKKFLSATGLEIVIRAHQYKAHLGFQVQKHAKLITVFSSSAYCGGENESSCVFISDGKINLLRLDSVAQFM